MENKGRYCINISAPNLINICVDQMQHGEIKGRLYHCYSGEPIIFLNVIELIRMAEKLFDEIAFPQASTKTRSLLQKDNNPTINMRRPEKILAQSQIVEKTGVLGTFVTSVRFRQNSTWQGEMYWVEQDEIIKFSNVLDFIKGLDVALQ